MRDKRVLQVAGSMNIGGAEVLLMNFLRSLTVEEARSIDFLVFGYYPQFFEQEIRELGSNIIRISPPRRSFPRAFAKELECLLTGQGPYEVVHSHVNLTSSVVLRTAKKCGVPRRVAHAHIANDGGGFFQGLYHHVASLIIRRSATDLPACSPEAGAYLFGDSWARRGLVVPNAVPIKDFAGRSDATKQALRAELKVDPDDVLIGSVSRLVDFKNLGFLIPIVAQALQDGLRFRLAIVGDGPERSKLESLTAELGMSERVTFLGMRNDVARIFRGLDVLVAPSFYEGLPVSLIEAQAAGLPAVVSRGISPSAAVVDGLVQFVPIDDPRDWIQPIIKASTRQVSPQQIQQDMHRHGYTIDSLVSSFMRLYGWDQ